MFRNIRLFSKLITNIKGPSINNGDLSTLIFTKYEIRKIEESYNDLDENLQKFIKLHTIHDFSTNPFDDRWIITNLLKKYNISTAEILVTLYQTRNPYNQEYVQCNSLHLSLSNAKYLININCTEDYWNIDHCSGSPIKAMFPKNINTHDMIIFRNSHDKLSTYKCITKIADLIMNKHIDYSKLS